MNKITLALAAAMMLAACGEKQAPAEKAPAKTQAAASAEEGDADSAAPAIVVPPPPPSKVDEVDWPATSTYAKISTSMGDFTVALYPGKAPKSVANFLDYAKSGFYDRLIIHRVVPGFVIQGGGYSQYFQPRPTKAEVPYEGDNGLGNYRTTIAMARTSDPDSATSQWFINIRDNNSKLDHFVNDLGPRYGYTVFGRVVEGMDVVDKIGALPTGEGGPFESEVPNPLVIINRVDPVEKPAQ
ncbi:MAG: peptidylprolyl isomerase [Parvularculaceae bacterium]